MNINVNKPTTTLTSVSTTTTLTSASAITQLKVINLFSTCYFDKLIMT